MQNTPLLTPGFKPGIVSLIQTHSGTLDWNCHLHLIVTDGAVDYSELANIRFRPCGFWNVATMIGIFRFELIEAMFKTGVLTPEVANNLVSYAGFYASIVQCAARKAAAASGSALPRCREARAVKPKWAALISKIFGALPITCPKCGFAMDLKEFILAEKLITKIFPDAARAPPKLIFDRYVTPVNELVYGNIEDDAAANDQFSQLQRNDDAFFNQEITLCPESVEGW